MEKGVVQKLNRLNARFYEKVAPYFDESRSYFWPGWEKLLPFVKDSRTDHLHELKVLDVGCGNGRFGVFLKENIDNFSNKNYFGLDFDSYLLSQAKENMPRSNFYQVDVLSSDFDSIFPEDQIFNLIVLFGVLHHIPGFKTRVDLLKKLMKKLKPEGHLIFSTWDFLDSPSLKRRIQPWSLLDLEEEKVEEDDYLLDWKKGEEALRYCHYFTDKEVKKLCRGSLLKIEETFKSSQRGDKYNRYFVTGV